VTRNNERIAAASTDSVVDALVGHRVLLRNFNSRAGKALNGRVGTVLSFADDGPRGGRYGVQLSGDSSVPQLTQIPTSDDISEKSRVVNVRRENFEVTCFPGAEYWEERYKYVSGTRLSPPHAVTQEQRVSYRKTAYMVEMLQSGGLMGAGGAGQINYWIPGLHDEEIQVVMQWLHKGELEIGSRRPDREDLGVLGSPSTILGPVIQWLDRWGEVVIFGYHPTKGFGARCIRFDYPAPSEMQDGSQIWLKDDAFVGEVCVEALLHAHAAVNAHGGDTPEVRRALDELVTLFFEIVCSNNMGPLLKTHVGGDHGETAWRRKLISAMTIVADTAVARPWGEETRRPAGVESAAEFALERYLLLAELGNLYIDEGKFILQENEGSCTGIYCHFKVVYRVGDAAQAALAHYDRLSDLIDSSPLRDNFKVFTRWNRDILAKQKLTAVTWIEQARAAEADQVAQHGLAAARTRDGEL